MSTQPTLRQLTTDRFSRRLERMLARQEPLIENGFLIRYVARQVLQLPLFKSNAMGLLLHGYVASRGIEDLMETWPVIFTKAFPVLGVSDTKDKTQPQMQLPTRLALICSGRPLSCFSVIINTAILVLSTMLHQDGVTSDGDGSRPRLQGDCG